MTPRATLQEAGDEKRAQPACTDEAVLMTRVAASDRLAFELVYRRYAPRVRAFLRRRLPGRALADDACHETMLVVWRRARSFDGSSKLSTWIFAIANRKGLQSLRRCGLELRALVRIEAQEAALEPDRLLQQLQLRVRVRRALAALPAEQRAVLRLFYFRGRACREIASITRVPLQTVKTRAFHARRKLRAVLAAEREAD